VQFAPEREYTATMSFGSAELAIAKQEVTLLPIRHSPISNQSIKGRAICDNTESAEMRYTPVVGVQLPVPGRCHVPTPLIGCKTGSTLNEFRWLSGRGSGSPLTRTFAGSKPLPAAFPYRPLI